MSSSLSGPGPRSRAKQTYIGVSLILLNTVLLLLFANLMCAGALGVLRARRQRDADFRLAGMDRATAMKAYPGWAQADLAQLLRETCSRPYQFEPYVGFSDRPFHGRYVNVETAGFRSIGRPEAWPPNAANFNVFVFGGSTTFGWAVPDADTIAANLQRQFDTPGQRIVVYNFGRDGYISAQEMVLLSRLVSEGYVPSLAIFIDGLNDFANWTGEPDRSDEMRRLVEDQQTGSAMGPATLLALRTPLGEVFEGIAQKAIHYNRLAGYALHTDADAIGRVVARWRAQKKLIEGMAQAHHFQTAFVWQPVPVYRYDLSRHFLSGAGGNWFDYGERAKAGYPVMARMRRDLERDGNFLWLADEQEGRTDNLYVDGFHYTAAFSHDLGCKIAEFLEPRINPARMHSHNLPSTPGPGPL